jgi:hypothetical protein
MASKILGLGTVVKVADAAITLLLSATPPKRSRVLIDGTALADTLATNELGIESHSEFVFTQFWEPNDTMHQSIDTLFENKTEAVFKTEYTNGVSDSFSGKVSELAPQQIESGGLIQRQVTIQRTTAITRSA